MIVSEIPIYKFYILVYQSIENKREMWLRRSPSQAKEMVKALLAGVKKLWIQVRSTILAYVAADRQEE